VFKVPNCQDKIREGNGSLVRCPNQAHWVVSAPDRSTHRLICKAHGLFYSGVDLVAIDYVVSQFAAIAAEPEWPARFKWPQEPRPEPPPRVCIVCGDQAAGPLRWCAGCEYWVHRQSAFGKRVLMAIARREKGITLAQLRAEPGRLRGVRNIGPKSAQWLLEVKLPVREHV
jgi:hypothetical protein